MSTYVSHNHVCYTVNFMVLFRGFTLLSISSSSAPSVSGSSWSHFQYLMLQFNSTGFPAEPGNLENLEN